MINESLKNRSLDRALWSFSSALFVATFLLFRSAPPAIDVYNFYDYVDVILSRAFVATLLLYAIGITLMVWGFVRMIKLKRGRRSISIKILSIVTPLLFIGVTFYLLGYLGFYNTFDINFVMPFRAYHPPF